MPFHTIQNVKSQTVIPGFHARFIHSKNMTFAFWDVDKGAELPEHSHPHEQVAKVIEGEFELTIDGKTQIVKPGMLAVIPSNVKHSGRALTECKLLDVFYPLREDYK